MQPTILNIALDVPLNRTFDYLSGDFNAQVGNRVQVGSRVIVPFAGRSLVGVVIAIKQSSDLPIEKLKAVSHVFDGVLLTDFKLLKFCADYYHYPFGQALISTLPLRLRQLKPAVSRKMFVYSLIKGADLTQVPAKKVVLNRIIAALQPQGLSPQNISAKADYSYVKAQGLSPQSMPAEVDYSCVNTAPVLTPSDAALISSGWKKAILELKNLGVVAEHEVLAIKASLPASAAEPQLNSEQTQAISQVLALTHTFKPWLLHGITGSGKTEVYIQILRQILQQNNAQGHGAQVLVLVPEINLTPQLEARFRSRLSQYPLVTLHSHLSESERLQHWLAASSGQAKIVIGTRLSVFTPMPYLKMIVMDEEHDGSYKQQDGMRYHARDVAMVRAKQLNIPIILGSATPSLESWHNATQHHATQHNATQPSRHQKLPYGLLSLTARAVQNAQLPSIACIDIAKSPVEDGISPILLKALRARLARGEQSLVFLNRRGYAPVLHCNACQWASSCTRCSAKMVVHLSQKRLKCHHCGAEQKIPVQCPSCGNTDIRPVGLATQRLEQTLQAALPTARIARVDRDSMRNKEALIQLLGQVHAGEVDILIGTQMLAKGHDFPNLTLVAVLDTDSALHSPDFRASEKLFAQLMQVAGRAGRAAIAGEVLIQTAFPQHALFNALRSQDYVRFADELLLERKTMQYPPASYFALLRAEAGDYGVVNQFLNAAGNVARNLNINDIKQTVMIYDIVRPQMERLNNMERGQLLLQANSRAALQRLLQNAMPPIRELPIANKVRWSLDIDPLEF